LVTAIGAISIVVATLNILFGMQTGVQSLTFHVLMQFAPPGAVNTTTTTTTSGSGSATVGTSAKGPSQSSNPATLTAFPRIGAGPMVLGTFDAVASLVLAVILLVAGIGALRHSRGSLDLHKFYGWAKIPISILGGIAYGWTMSQMLSSLPFGTPSGSLLFCMYAVFMAVLGCSYPIGLLIALRTETVRGYYNSIV